MSQVCIEDCAPKRNCYWFVPKQNLQITEMPRFDVKEAMEMTREEDRVDIAEFLWLFDMFPSLLPDELEIIDRKV